MTQELAVPKTKPNGNSKPRKKPEVKTAKHDKHERYTIDTAGAVIVHGKDRFVYDQIKIISRNSRVEELKVSDFVQDTSVEPENVAMVIDNAILRVITYHGKHHILSGKAKYLEAVKDKATVVKAHVVAAMALNRTLVPPPAPKVLSPEELKSKMSSNSGLFAQARIRK